MLDIWVYSFRKLKAFLVMLMVGGAVAILTANCTVGRGCDGALKEIGHCLAGAYSPLELIFD